MQSLLPIAEQVAARLKARNETISIAESSTGGLISAALLAVPGASGYFLGGAVVYTIAARGALAAISEDDMAGLRASTEPYARLLAERARTRLGAVWGLGETGATGPAGNRYGDPPGHCCIAVCGPVAHSTTVETASSDRQANMRAFAHAALSELLLAIDRA